MGLAYPYNLQQPKISLIYLKALLYTKTKDIQGICWKIKMYQLGDLKVRIPDV